MSEIESLLAEFINNVSNKLKSTESELKTTQTELKLTQAELKSTESELKLIQEITTNLIKSSLDSFNVKLEQLKTELATSSAPNAANIPSVQTSHDDDLTKLPAYKYAAAFKEIRRPITLNELYMMVLQSQHSIYELQMHTDNILRRS